MKNYNTKIGFLDDRVKELLVNPELVSGSQEISPSNLRT
jgi:hypothetical protein